MEGHGLTEVKLQYSNVEHVAVAVAVEVARAAGRSAAEVILESKEEPRSLFPKYPSKGPILLKRDSRMQAKTEKLPVEAFLAAETSDRSFILRCAAYRGSARWGRLWWWRWAL